MKKIFIEKLTALVTAAFGLVAALGWNGAIQAIFAKYYEVGEGILPKLVYAFAVTFIAVVVILGMGKLEERSKAINLKDQIKLEKLRAARLKKKE